MSKFNNFAIPHRICDICRKAAKTSTGTPVSDSPWEFGPVLEKEGLLVHYFCLLFMDGLIQSSEDTEGLCGFLARDVRDQIKVIRRRHCYLCKGQQAGIRCGVAECTKTFHFVCAMDKGSLAQFEDETSYPMYCTAHSKEILDTYFDHDNYPLVPVFKADDECKLCSAPLDPDHKEFNSSKFIYSPCCYFGYMHRSCLQRMAFTSGHYFKCPGPQCGDESEEINLKFRRLGIFIPCRSATWEMETDRYYDLESSQIDTTYDQKFSFDATVTITRCDYPRCLDYHRILTSEHIVKCTTCKTSIAHKKCHLYFTNTKVVAAKGGRPPTPKQMPKFQCRSCYSQTCLSQI